MLLTEDPEKIPDTPHCTAGAPGGQPACSPGFFDERWENRPLPTADQRVHACCEGYFCPPQLTCMIPCPLGSFCPRQVALPLAAWLCCFAACSAMGRASPARLLVRWPTACTPLPLPRCRAWPAQPPPAYSSGTGDTKWCAPYAYKQRQELGCGGADKWRIVPGSAFPAAWWSEGSGSIYW